MEISKNMTNNQIAELLRAVAASYQLKGEDNNRFRIIAYQRAADAVEHASSELKDLWDEGRLSDIPSIGKSISFHLDELFRTGKSRHFESVMKGFPPVMFKLMEIPGIGAKRALIISNNFKDKIRLKSPFDDLEKLLMSHKISKLESFGEDSEKDILQSIREVKGREMRLLLPYAEEVSNELIGWIRKNKFAIEVECLGSLRRKVSTVGDIDIAVATEKGNEIISHFVKYPKKKRIIEKGEKTASILLPNEIQADLMVQVPQAFGALLQHFTGSKHHNIALREYAKSLSPSLSLSEYGIRNLKTKKLKKVKTEEEFYNALNLDWIPSELREDSGEIEASKNKKLPSLIDLKDIKADLQIHSDFDIETSHDLGESDMESILEKANHIGYQYFAFTEHNPSHSKHKDKEIVEILKRKRENVDKINYSLINRLNMRVKNVYNSLEIDILPNGKLPIPDSAFETLDFALVSIHSSFRQNKKDMTKRILEGLSHPKVKIFAHPTARKLMQREGVEIDWDIIFDFSLKYNKWLEINADPMRLDLPDFLVRDAIKKGLKMCLGTDSHHYSHMDNMKYAVYVARRGWAEKKDIVNTRSLEEFEKMIR